MPRQRTAIVVGDGQMAAQCAKLIVEHDELELPLIIHHASEQFSEVDKLCQAHSIRHELVRNVNDAEVVHLLRKICPDVMFSINNWDIIRPELREIPRHGTINFHNGPLPAYRGVNAPSWAIINGETRHGVTWHYINAGIDTGDIVASTEFSLAPDETAISLIFRCIRAGVELFSPLLDRYANDALERWPQRGEAHYYSATDTPDDGYLDFNCDFARLSALVRGLSFRPFDNLFTWPKIRTGKGMLLLTSITREGDRTGENWTCGSVQTVDSRGVVVCAKDSLVRLSGLMEEDFSAPPAPVLAERHGLVAGSVLGSVGH